MCKHSWRHLHNHEDETGPVHMYECRLCGALKQTGWEACTWRAVAYYQSREGARRKVRSRIQVNKKPTLKNELRLHRRVQWRLP